MDNIFEKAIKKGFADCETSTSKGESFEVRIFEKEISQYKNSHSFSLDLRGTFSEKMGYASTEVASDDVIDDLLNQTKDNALLLETADNEFLYKEKKQYPTVNNYNENFKNFPVEKKIALAKQLEEEAKSLDPKIVSVDYCVLGSGEGSLNLKNSYGIDLFQKSNICYAYLSLRGIYNGETKTATELWFDNDFNNFDPKELALTTFNAMFEKFGAKSIAPTNCQVVIKNSAVSDLFGAFMKVFYAENVQKGFSLLKGKIGENIASENVTIKDLAIFGNSLGNTAFDSEGVPCQNKSIISDGKLVTFLHNLKSAKKDGVEPTGNGFKMSGSIGTACTNLTLACGDFTQDALFEKMYNGLYITELAGLHSGTNAISGDFSLMAQGFLIEKGHKTKAVEQIVVSGNFYTLLKDIIAVGSDSKADMPSSLGTYCMPSILVKNLSVTGSER